MTRQEFMNRLEYLLRDIPAGERADALAYYNDYFEEAGAENEYQVLQELGSPEAVAATILADWQQETHTSNQHREVAEKTKMSTGTKILLVIVIILTFPLWIGVVAGLFGAIVGVIGALFGIAVGLVGAAIGLVAGGVGCAIIGITCVALRPVEGLAGIGVGTLLAALGLLLTLFCVWCLGVWLPKGIKALVHWIKGLAHRKEGGNEI